ncbi:MAG: histidine kinase dimerization/phosphoacceptor domain -containing protein [Balneolaceae bacterium]|nr:histidine kinase dimerization/phosphoacceptor domain -containing protein [Balneolaceae bacterium]
METHTKESLHLLLETIDGINRTMELKALLNESMEATRIVMDSEASSLMLLDEDTEELYVSLPTGPVKEEIKGLSIPRHEGIGGWVVENKSPFISNDVENTEFFWGDLAEDFTTRNIICVPLINRDNEVFGVLQAVNRRKGEEYTAHDIPVFQALAAHVSLAIERARQIERLHNRLKEKEVMLTEIHHRIKNNLGAISSLIEMELPNVDDPYARQIMKNTYTRIHSMSEVHDLLCQKGLFRDIELGLYLKQLVKKIEKTMNTASTKISIHLKADNIHIPANKALVCGLILNEMLVNIYKHAFEGMKRGDIIIDLALEEEQQIVLEIKDNGVGIPEDFEDRQRGSLGMWIVNAFMKKLDGELEMSGDNGTRFRFRFEA